MEFTKIFFLKQVGVVYILFEDWDELYECEFCKIYIFLYIYIKEKITLERAQQSRVVAVEMEVLPRVKRGFLYTYQYVSHTYAHIYVERYICTVKYSHLFLAVISFL